MDGRPGVDIQALDDLERAVAGAEDRSASWSGLTYALLRSTVQ